MAKASFFGNSSSGKETASTNDIQSTADTTIIEQQPPSAKTSKGDSLIDHNSTSQENDFFRAALWVILGTLLLLIITFGVGFFTTLRGAEKTVIPHVINLELTDALIEIQEKGLNPRIQVKYTENPDDKGMVVDQTPSSGQAVKAGRQVTLVVSKGAVIENIGDYSSMTLDELKLELQTAFASFQAMIQVGEVVYQYSEEPKGRIIAQDPAAGTTISGLTKLNLVISRGMEEGTFKVENYTGMKYSEVLDLLAQENRPFVFHIDSDAPAQNESVVFRQVPAIGEVVKLGTPLELYINSLSDRALNNAGDDMVFDLFEYQLPQYMVPMDMKLERIVGATDPEVLLEMKYPGGTLSIPYLESTGTNLRLFVNGKEQISFIVP